MPPRWIIIADDLTGACDTGAAYAAHWRTRVALDPDVPFGDAEVLVLTTESRSLTEPDAVRAVERALSKIAFDPETRFYKKIDSTLRGHPAAELRSLMRALGIPSALITPAFPAQGRVVREGRVFVGAVPLEILPFARQAAAADLPRLFGPEAMPLTLEDLRRTEADLVNRMARISGPLVADAETDDDLLALARAALRAHLRLFCGSAGLARALVAAEREREPSIASSTFGKGVQNTRTCSGPVLVIAGSRHPVTAAQVRALEQKGASVFSLSDAPMGPSLDAAEISQTARRLSDSLQRGKTTVLSAAGLADRPGAEQRIAAQLAALAAAAIGRTPAGGLVLTGGDTAVSVLRALGCQVIDLGGEVMPGLAWGWLAHGSHAGLPLVTKAGGFGAEDALVKAVQFINEKWPG